MRGMKRPQQTNEESAKEEDILTATGNRVKNNLRFLRKEFFRKAGYSTIEMGVAIGSNSDKIQRIEASLKGTIQSFIVLLWFYHKQGFSLDDLLTKDFEQAPPSFVRMTIEERRLIKVDEAEQQQVCELLRSNLNFLRKQVLRGSRFTTDNLVEVTGIASEKLLRIEKRLQGKIISIVALLNYYIHEGLQLHELMASDLREDNRALSEVKTQMHLMDRFMGD